MFSYKICKSLIPVFLVVRRVCTPTTGESGLVGLMNLEYGMIKPKIKKHYFVGQRESMHVSHLFKAYSNGPVDIIFLIPHCYSNPLYRCIPPFIFKSNKYLFFICKPPFG